MSDSPKVPEPSKALADAAAAVFEAAQVPAKPEVQDLESARALGSAAAALARAAEALAVASQRAASGETSATAPTGAEQPGATALEEAQPYEDPEAHLSDEEKRERRRLRAAVPTGAMDDPMLQLPPGDLPPMPPAWLEKFIKPSELLSPREETIRAAKIYWRIKLIIGLTLGFFVLVMLARPVARSIRSYQASRVAASATVLMDAGKWNEGMKEAYDAYQLRPTESSAIRVAARAMTYLKDPRGLELWEQLRERKELTEADLRNFAGLASATGRLTQAEELLRQLLTRPGGGQVQDRIAEAWLLSLRGEREKAGEIAKALLTDPRATTPERVNAAALMAEQASASYQKEGWAELEKLAVTLDESGLAALMHVGRRALSDGTPPAEAEKWSRLLKAHPQGGIGAWLLALNLEMKHLNLARETAVNDALAKFGRSTSDEVIATLARWLVALGEYERALDQVNLEIAARTPVFASIHVSALRGLNRWKDIRSLIQGEKIQLTGYEADLQLAIATSRLGEQTAAARRWKKLSDLVSGNAPAVIALAQTAEENGAPEIAEPLYRDATKLAPLLRGGWDGLLRAAEARGDTTELVSILNSARKSMPNDRLMRMNWAHATALIGKDLEEARKVAEVLIKDGTPGGMASLTLALIQVRLGRPEAAKAALGSTPLGDLNRLEGKSFTPSQLVVAAAVLAASGQMKEAKVIAQALEKSRLRKEERDMVQRILEN